MGVCVLRRWTFIFYTKVPPRLIVSVVCTDDPLPFTRLQYRPEEVQHGDLTSDVCVWVLGWSFKTLIEIPCLTSSVYSKTALVAITLLAPSAKDSLCQSSASG